MIPSLSRIALIVAMTTSDDLLAYIFDANRPALYPDLEGWVRDSRRFKAFALAYRTKIRAKLKNVHDEGGMKDLRAELQAAALLLRSERFTLEYEKYAAAKQRGPDFTVTYKTHTPFNVEVRRIRSIEWDHGDPDARIVKLMTVFCEKLGQMPPSIVNLLWLTADRDLSEADLTRAVTILRQLADRKTDDFFIRRGFANVADFFKQYSRLSGIVLPRSDKIILWLNPLARHQLPPEIAATLRRL